ncbi:hypothetical protein EVG20_g4545 [Dentipellis fragilis]|uniref:Uncharacterized protein n=1 Tax=Dentipellis fragilis TaxID=205917 RepID=A0A4Y9YXR8_9AGAM|nr:hypothetical protein EVG20_g4545 [Dentipellis fragilis]
MVLAWVIKDEAIESVNIVHFDNELPTGRPIAFHIIANRFQRTPVDTIRPSSEPTLPMSTHARSLLVLTCTESDSALTCENCTHCLARICNFTRRMSIDASPPSASTQGFRLHAIQSCTESKRFEIPALRLNPRTTARGANAVRCLRRLKVRGVQQLQGTRTGTENAAFMIVPCSQMSMIQYNTVTRRPPTLSIQYHPHWATSFTCVIFTSAFPNSSSILRMLLTESQCSYMRMRIQQRSPDMPVSVSGSGSSNATTGTSAHAHLDSLPPDKQQVVPLRLDDRPKRPAHGGTTRLVHCGDQMREDVRDHVVVPRLGRHHGELGVRRGEDGRERVAVCEAAVDQRERSTLRERRSEPLADLGVSVCVLSGGLVRVERVPACIA